MRVIYRCYTDGREWGQDFTRAQALCAAKSWRATWPSHRIYCRRVR